MTSGILLPQREVFVSFWFNVKHSSDNSDQLLQITLFILIVTIESEKIYMVSQKKWDLLLVIVAVNPTFFWDTLYIDTDLMKENAFC